MSFYIKRCYVDSQPGIELVNIHYTWTPVGQPPNWEAHRETRAMPRGGFSSRGWGAPPSAGQANTVQTMSHKSNFLTMVTRRKVIRLPKDVLDPPPGRTSKASPSSLL